MVANHRPEDSERHVRLLGDISARFVRADAIDYATSLRRSLEDLATLLALDACALATVVPEEELDPRRTWTWTRRTDMSVLDLVAHLLAQDGPVLAEDRVCIVRSDTARGVVGDDMHALGLVEVVAVPATHNGLAALLVCGANGAREWDRATIGLARAVLNVLVSACQRQEAQAELALSRQDLERALDLAGLGTFVLDLRTGVAHLSPAMADMFGFGPRSVSAPAAEVAARFHADDRSYFFHLLGDVTNEAPGSHVQLRVEQPEGDPLLLRFTSELVHDADGKPVALRGTALDMTTVERHSSEMARVEEAAYRAKVEAELARGRRLESLGLLAGGVAHDFNNLLAIISNHATLLEKSVTDDPQGQADLSAIRKAVQDAAVLSRRLLTFGGRGATSSPRMIPDPGRVVTESLQLLESTVPIGVGLSLDIEGDVPDIVADPGDLQQVLSNLVANALDAVGDEGHVEVRVRPVRIGIDEAQAGRPAGTYVTIEVADDGVGMTPEQVERAFDPFFSAKLDRGGSGLGLSIVHGITASLFGWVDIESEPGTGSVVTVAIPARGPPVEAEGSEPIPAEDDDATDVSGSVILLVDDSGDLLASTARILREAGYTVLETQSPMQAVDVAARHTDGVDLAVTDIVMPGMSGPELAAALRTHHPDMAVLHVSGHVPPDVTPQDRVLDKPFEPDTLLRAVQSSLATGSG
ncbi:MAG: response regulator [Acidimicrobiia bacterium]|nr:response regulator [Acidimicrobiia bacterium]